MRFKTKKQEECWVRSQIAEYPLGRIPFGSDLHTYLVQLFQDYSKYQEKIGCGLSFFAVVMIDRGRGPTRRGIDLVRKDGTRCGISAYNAIRERGSTTEQIAKRRAVRGLRNEVRDQTESFSQSGFDVHHDPPFIDVARSFLEYKQIQWEDIVIEPHDSRYHSPLKDRRIAHEWQIFHRENATLSSVPIEIHRKGIHGSRKSAGSIEE